MKLGCLLWKNFSILIWSNERPLWLSIFSRYNNFNFIMTCPTTCIQATHYIHNMPFDEGWFKDIIKAWKTIVHATLLSDSWKTIDYIKQISSFPCLPWHEVFSFTLFLSPLFFWFIIIAVWLFIIEKLTYISVNIKYIPHFYFPLKCMPFFGVCLCC